MNLLTSSVKVVAGLACALLLASCGQFFPGSKTIVSLAVAPASAQVKPGANQQFSATATYGNNSTGDVSSSVTWTSSSTGIATINTSGLATAGTRLGCRQHHRQVRQRDLQYRQADGQQ